jgi:hypothetical protein
MGESGRETEVSKRMGRVVTLSFPSCDDGLVKATKLNKGHPHPSKHRRVYRAHANATFKAPNRFLR